MAKAIVVVIVIALLAVVVGGYVVFQRQTPVSLQEAIERFHDQNDQFTMGTRVVARNDRKGLPAQQHGSKQRPIRTPSDGAGTASDARNGQIKVNAETTSSIARVISAPAEGVYSYVGSGSEGFGVVTREFPSETQRIVTHEDRNTWVEHHIFSEERASWSRISTGATARLVHHQRNYIKIGPHVEDKTLFFDPVIPSALFPPTVGETWDGEARGRTNHGERFVATYRCKTFVEEEWVVGGVSVRVLGVLLEMELRGDINGTASIKRWFSPSYGLNVREDYSADVSLGAVTYQADWSVKLQSLTPDT